MKAMILAAGLGLRLRPLTLERAKPAIPLLGKPLVIRLIENLMDQGVTQFRLNLHHLPRTIESLFGVSAERDLPVSFSHEQTILGTAGGLKANQSFFGDETFLMVNGDIVFDFRLDQAVAFHRKMEALATLILYPQKPPYRHVQVRIDREGRLHDFKDAPSPTSAISPETYVFTGVHILEPEIFQFIPPGTFYEINDQVYPSALKIGKRVLGFPVQGYWNDIGHPARYLEAQKELFSRQGILPPTHISPGAKVHETARIGPYISAEDGCIIGSDTTAENAIFWENTHLEKGSLVRNCITGTGVTIRTDCLDRIITRNGEVPLVFD